MKNIDTKAINKYINDSFLRIARSMGFYQNINFMFNYVIIQNESLKYPYMIPLHDRSEICPYEEVVSELFYNLYMEFFKKFGIMFKPSLSKREENKYGEFIKPEIYPFVCINCFAIELNYQVAEISVKSSKGGYSSDVSLMIVPNHYKNIRPSRSIQLMLKYYNMTYADYMDMKRYENTHHIQTQPDLSLSGTKVTYEWKEFCELYLNTFKKKPWEDYNFTFSSVTDPDMEFILNDPLE